MSKTTQYATAFALTLTVLTAAQAKDFVVGYANLADTDVFTMSRKNAFIAAAKADPSMKISFADANGDISKQLDQIDNFIAQKVGAIIVVPVDYQGIVPGVEKANKAGIPVIALGIESAGGKYTFVGSKNLDAGRMQGEYMAKVLPKNAKIVYLQGQPGLYHSKERLEGFTKALASRSDVKILANLPANYDRAEGMKVTEDWVQRFPQFDALIAANDQMALRTAGAQGRQSQRCDDLRHRRHHGRTGGHQVRRDVAVDLPERQGPSRRRLQGGEDDHGRQATAQGNAHSL